jgi:hypothetical protein
MKNPMIILFSMLGCVAVSVSQDIAAWKSWGDAKFNWSVASWRWFQAAIIGLCAGITATQTVN